MKGRASAELRIDGNLSAMQAREVLDDRKAQACPAHITRPPAVHPVQALENAPEVLFRDALARVSDGDHR